MSSNAESANAVFIFDRKGNPTVMLPPGTVRVKYDLPGAEPDRNVDEFYIPGTGETIKVYRREGKVRNETKDTDICDIDV